MNNPIPILCVLYEATKHMDVWELQGMMQSI